MDFEFGQPARFQSDEKRNAKIGRNINIRSWKSIQAPADSGCDQRASQDNVITIWLVIEYFARRNQYRQKSRDQENRNGRELTDQHTDDSANAEIEGMRGGNGE